jgi:hypothetical protein
LDFCGHKYGTGTFIKFSDSVNKKLRWIRNVDGFF